MADKYRKESTVKKRIPEILFGRRMVSLMMTAALAACGQSGGQSGLFQPGQIVGGR
jgi:hypothetical protein